MLYYFFNLIKVLLKKKFTLVASKTIKYNYRGCLASWLWMRTKECFWASPHFHLLPEIDMDSYKERGNQRKIGRGQEERCLSDCNGRPWVSSPISGWLPAAASATCFTPPSTIDRDDQQIQVQATPGMFNGGDYIWQNADSLIIIVCHFLADDWHFPVARQLEV